MLSLLESITLVSLSNFRITLTVSLTAHCEIHANLGALTVEVSLKVLDHLLVSTFLACSAENVNSSERSLAVILKLRELRCWSLAQWTLLRSSLTFINVATNGTDKLFLHNVDVLLS